MKKFFPKLSVKDICILGLLVAITTVLAVYCTIRVGEVVKIPLKFISIFVTAVLYGPVYGGLIAALGDLFNCIFAPSGAILPQITAIEFLGGFVFGLFFLGERFSKKGYLIRTIGCVLVLMVIDMFLTTALFSWGLKWFPSFGVAFVSRSVAGVIKVVLHFVVILMMRNHIEKLRRLKK